MKKIILSVALTALICIGFFSFKSITETRTKDYCIISTDFGTSNYFLTIKFGDNKEEAFEGKIKFYQNDLVNVFHKLNIDGWEYKGIETYPRINSGYSSAAISNFIFERNHKE